MSLDPEELFVVTQLSRRTIAEDLNDYIDDLGETDPFPRLNPDDERLTGTFCAEYAVAIGNLCGESEDELADQAAEVYAEFLGKLGWQDPNP